MSLADSLKSEKKEQHARSCLVNGVLAKLSKADAKILTAAVDNPLITAPQIARALQREGHVISPSPIQRHRRRDCPCWDKE